MLLCPFLSQRQKILVIHTANLSLGVGIGRIAVIRLQRAFELVYCRSKFRQSGSAAPCEIVGIAYGHLVLLSRSLGCDKDHAEGRTGTVDCRRRGVFKHGNIGNVFRIDEVEVINRHTVNHNKGRRRLSVRERSDTTNTNTRTGGDATIILSDSETGYCTLQCLGDVLYRTAVHHAGNVDGGDGAGEVCFFLRAVADGHEFVELLGGGLEVDGHIRGCSHVHGLISHIAEFELCAGGHTQFEVTECVGSHGVCLNTFLNNGSTDYGLVVFVEYRTGDCGSGLALLLRHWVGGCREADRGNPCQQKHYSE